MDRKKTLDYLNENPDKIWDLIVIGGGATGLGVALDAGLRGLSTLLIEQSDFTKGTSSRSTKLVHGGVRYLAQGNIGLVLEALRERGFLLKNAPHVTFNQSFIIPAYSTSKTWFYAAGLKLYDLLSGGLTLGKSVVISKDKVLQDLVNIKSDGLKNGILYQDGQFDDARLGINLAQSAADQGAHLVNYMQVISLNKENKLWNIQANELEGNKLYHLKSKTLINATGVFVDNILKFNDKNAEQIVKVSQGTHIVLNKSFLPGNAALMIPETSDGRVLFAIPWHDKVIIGTTDTSAEKAELEPLPLQSEVNFILENLEKYLVKMPEKKDILSAFTGLRPLAMPSEKNKSTKEISRRHKLIVSDNGLITITGGKWTTYRQMAEETVDKAVESGKFTGLPCSTKNFKIHGFPDNIKPVDSNLKIYGSDAHEIIQLMNINPGYREKLHKDYFFTKAEVVWFARNEMARTVEDVLARRMRILFLDAKAAIEMAPVVSEILAEELGKEQEWIKKQIEIFTSVASGYLYQ